MSIDDELEEFIERNPKIWNRFCRYTFELIRAGRKHGSARMVFHRMRWETELRGDDDGFKINNKWSAPMVRRFNRRNPDHADFFRTRDSVTG